MASDQVPTHVSALIDLFGQELGGVQFGDVDLGMLEERVRELDEAAEKEAEAYRVLQDARRDLDRALLRLEERSERALAYARVYARDHEPLAERVEEIAGSWPGLQPKKAKRRKKAKPKIEAVAPAEELPFDPTGT